MRQMTLTSALLVFWILAVVWGQGVRVTRPQIKLTAEQEIRACQKCHGNPYI